MMRGNYAGRRRPTSNVTLALVGFIVLCGLVLLFGGDGSGCRGWGGTGGDSADIRAAWSAASRAEHALGARNYGQARRLIRETNERLRRVLGETEQDSQDSQKP